VAWVEEKVGGKEDENRGNAELPHVLACESDRALFGWIRGINVYTLHMKKSVFCLSLFCLLCSVKYQVGGLLRDVWRILDLYIIA
jgi:hypothetical protein